ncbi:MAG: FtsQ-type POTRA domain-containing protein [Gammaproteobacteria bacterium]|nr:FtsQ-type POTRA domain-containing protein [Gammaproteobacteria bacterium]
MTAMPNMIELLLERSILAQALIGFEQRIGSIRSNLRFLLSVNEETKTISSVTEVFGSHRQSATRKSRGRSIWVALIAFTLVVVLLVVLLADRLFHPEKFQINEIEVKGEFNHVDGQQIKEVVESYLVGNYFSASLLKLETHIEALPWVFSASLRRVWPSTLQVEIVEVQPVAKWGEDRWVNFTGDLVARQETQKAARLPLIDGPEKQRSMIWENFQTWSSLFGEHGLILNELKLDHGHLWYLDVSLGALAATYKESASASAAVLLDHSITVIVEKQEAKEKVERLIDVLKQELLLKFSRIHSIDLRYPNGFAVGWIEELANTTDADEISSESQ